MYSGIFNQGEGVDVNLRILTGLLYFSMEKPNQTHHVVPSQVLLYLHGIIGRPIH